MARIAPKTLTPHRMTDADDIRKFILGGNATFTLKNKRTGVRFTYRVRCKRDLVKNGRKVLSPYFVSVMTGSDNQTSYTYIGYIFSNPNKDGVHNFRHGTSKKGLRIPADAMQVKALEWLWMLVQGRNMNGTVRTDDLSAYPDFEFWHSGTCSCCGRELTVPESIKIGIGPVCAKWYL